MFCCSSLPEVTSPLLASIKEKDNVNRCGEVRPVSHTQKFSLESLKKKDKMYSFNRNHQYLKFAGKNQNGIFVSPCFTLWIILSASITEANLPSCHIACSHPLSPGFPVSLH